MKKCKKCLELKPLIEFHKKKSGVMGVKAVCKSCTSIWQSTHYLKVGYKRVKRQQNPSYKLGQRKNHLQKKYSMSLDQYDALLKAQNNCCATCKSSEPGGRSKIYFHVDHCHKTGKVRGLLCSACNQALGLIKDNLDTLKEMIKYVN